MQGLIERTYAAPVGVVLKVSAQNITHHEGDVQSLVTRIISGFLYIAGVLACLFSISGITNTAGGMLNRPKASRHHQRRHWRYHRTCMGDLECCYKPCYKRRRLIK